MTADVQHHLPVSPAVLEILVALGGAPLHGYAVAQAVRARSGGRIRLETGPLYRHLKRLLDDSLVAEAPRPEDDDARRGAYYRLTPLGRRVLAAESRRLGDLVAHVREAGLAPELGR
ncbi:MAG TPA: helix-turn-helix transcriptional regulator [Longimicrobiales bacterium]|nr:helix-turn-helix transcriptional regulator [Longimicrobiales bacterium]